MASPSAANLAPASLANETETGGDIKEVVMTVRSLPFVPPAPAVHPKNLPVWRLLWMGTRPSIWPDYAFDALYVRNSVMGLKTLLVNDPEGVRHVLSRTSRIIGALPSSRDSRARSAAQGSFSRKAPTGAASAVSWRRRSRRAAFASCCHTFATLVFICCSRSKGRREPISRKPFRTRLSRQSCARCFPCRRAAIARH